MKRFGLLVRFSFIVVIGGSLLGLCLAAFAPGIGIVSSAHTGIDRVDVAFSKLSSRTIVYDASGQEIGRLGIEDREPVKLSEVPEIMKKIVIASEDRTFWNNPGVDARAMMRAMTSNVSAGGVAQGGSTITQQLIKNRVLTNEKTFSRKIKEAVLAYRVTQSHSKEEILQEYLNTVYFGQGSYGIKSAVERFFRHPLSEMTLSEAALLTALIPNPESWNPFVFPDRARERRANILSLLRQEKIITEEQEREANAVPLPTVRPSAELKPDNYLVAEVQRRLLDDTRLGATAQERYNKVLRGGLKVHTSYDPDLQAAAQKAVDEKLPKQRPFTAAMIVMERNTGKVVAMVGGPGFQDAKYNLATQGERQPGSTYKIVTLTAAINKGFSPQDTISGSSPCVVKPKGYPAWTTSNAEGGAGTGTLRNATAHSVNCAYARLISAVGVVSTSEMAESLGIDHDVPAFPSITLGTDEATPLEMTTVYNTISTGGIRHDPVFVTKVEGLDGEVLFEQRYTGTRVVTENVALTVTDMLRNVITGGTGTSARIPGHDAVGKTGTTEEYGDAWFCGMTMRYTSCVWMGDPAARTPMRNVGGRTVFGGTYPAAIWKSFMVAASFNQPNIAFAAPDKTKWPRGVYVTDQGRGKGAPPVNETIEDPSVVNPNATTTPVTIPPVPATAAPPTLTPVLP
ncbi:MAG TPA: transglycosylase domain-containing protein [Acidimicrobiia bacterium]|nr:transglycosylase domain-containing protein [Acidimicrobiia bacterium]